MGRCLQRQNSIRELEPPGFSEIFKLSRDVGHLDGVKVLSERFARQERTDIVGQYHSHCVYQPQRWSLNSPVSVGHVHLGGGNRQWTVHSVRANCGSRESSRGPLVKDHRQTQLDASRISTDSGNRTQSIKMYTNERAIRMFKKNISWRTVDWNQKPWDYRPYAFLTEQRGVICRVGFKL